MTALVTLYNTNHEALVKWVCKTYGIATDGPGAFNNPHRMRRESIARRLRLYRDQALVDVNTLIDQVYESVEYQATLKRYVRVALEQNVTRRIVDEVASLYDRPAVRKLKKRQDEFDKEEKRLHLHELMQEGHRLMTLCNEVLWWQYDGADGKTKIRLVTPDVFDAIPNPKDSLVEAGFLIDMKPTSMLEGDALKMLPHFELWDDTYRYLINAYGSLVDADGNLVTGPETHKDGIPGVLLHRREPTTCILDGDHGADIESAHLGVALLNVMIIRLSKVQGENQPILKGNLASMATGQVMNGEKPLMLPPEVTAEMLKMVTDPDHYLKVKKDKISSVGQSYGLSYEQFTVSETAATTSGKGYEIRREKLTEIRQESKRRAGINEPLIITLIGFDPIGMKVDHSEQALPQDAIEEVALLSDKMRMGLDSPIQYLMRKDQDLTREEAMALAEQNFEDFGLFILWLRMLNAPAGADATNPGQSPQQNGAMGGAQGPQIQLKVRSGQASQVIPTGLGDDNPISDAAATVNQAASSGNGTVAQAGRNY